ILEFRSLNRNLIEHFYSSSDSLSNSKCTMAVAITSSSLAIGVVSLAATSWLSSSAAVGYGLGWILQEFAVSIPLLAIGVAATKLLGWPIFDLLVEKTGFVPRSVMLGVLESWIAHFIFRTARMRRRFHHLVSGGSQH